MVRMTYGVLALAIMVMITVMMYIIGVRLIGGNATEYIVNIANSNVQPD